VGNRRSIVADLTDISRCRRKDLTVPDQALVAMTIRVSQDRDWIDYLSAFSGIAGIVLAITALCYSIWQSNQTKQDAIRERRVEFELGLLAEIRRQMAATGFSHLAGFVGALVVDPSNETDIPMTRAKVGVKATAEGQRMLIDLVNRTKNASALPELALQTAMEAEVDAAIQSRLEM
jgi:hypothetical protein